MNGTSETRSCGLATWSLVLGILALVLCPIGLLFAIPAVICGHKALGRIKLSGGTMQGGGMAITGLIMGYVGVAVSMLLVMLSIIAIPNFIKARNTALQHACVNNLRQIDGAKQQWALENTKKEDAIPSQADILPYIGSSGMMPFCQAGGTYTIHSVGELPTCSVPGHELPH